MVLHTTMVEQMRHQTEDIVRYYGEINRRIANTGIAGIPGLLELSQQVETAVAVVASQEIDWVVSELRNLLERLVRMDAQLQRLRELKTILADDAESGDPPSRRPGF
jgi:3-methyladenine DNA glycosylase/8-oxoguanine DNA glycosylase